MPTYVYFVDRYLLSGRLFILARKLQWITITFYLFLIIHNYD